MRKHAYLLVLTALFAIFGLWACKPDDVARTAETTRSSGSHRSGVESYCSDSAGQDTVDAYWDNITSFKNDNIALAKAFAYFMNDSAFATIVKNLALDTLIDGDYTTLISTLRDTLDTQLGFDLGDSVYVKLLLAGYNTTDANKIRGLINSGYVVYDGISFHLTIAFPFLDASHFNQSGWGGLYPTRCMGTFDGLESSYSGWYLNGSQVLTQTTFTDSLLGVTPIWVFGVSFGTVRPSCWVQSNMRDPMAKCFCFPTGCGAGTRWYCQGSFHPSGGGCGRMRNGNCTGGCAGLLDIKCE